MQHIVILGRSIASSVVLGLIVGGVAGEQLAHADENNAVFTRLEEHLKAGDHRAVAAGGEETLRAAERVFAGDDDKLASVVDLVGNSCLAVGDYDQARRLFERLVALHERLLGAGHPDTATSTTKLAIALWQLEDYERAEALYMKVLAIRERLHGPEHPEVAAIVSNLAVLYDTQARFQEAEEFNRRALAIREKSHGPDHPATAASLNNLAVFLEGQGQLADAEPLFRRTLAIFEKRNGPDHPSVAKPLSGLANIAAAQGLYPQAAELHRRALAIRETSLGMDHPETAESVSGLAIIEDMQGHYDQAEPLFRRALAIREKYLGPDHPDTAASLDNLAGLYKSQGQYAKADQTYKRAIAIYERVRGAEDPVVAKSLHSLAGLYELRGEHAQAEQLYARATAIFRKFMGESHPTTAASLNSLAELQASLDRWPDAATHLDLARRAMRRYIAHVLPSLTADEQASFLHSRDENLFHSALTFGLLQRANPAIAAASAAWLANGKAVAHDAASQRMILARQSDSPAITAAIAALGRVRFELSRLNRMSPATRSSNEVAAGRLRIAKLQAEERQFIHEIGGQLAALDRDEPWVEIDAVRKNIPAGGVLVDIARLGIRDFKAKEQGNMWQPARYAAWIVPPAGKGDVTIIDLGEAEAIDAAVAAYREAIEAVQKHGGRFPRGQAAEEDELKIIAAPLATKALQPIVDAVKSTSEIILSPDGALWLVPWQALPLADGSYAIEKFAIRTVTSARDLVPMSVEAKGRKGGSVVVADPDFELSPQGVVSPGDDSSRSLAKPASIQRFDRLPSTRGEALAMRPVLVELTGNEPTMLLGPEASEDNFRRAAVRPKTIVLATHGFFMNDQQVKRDDFGPVLAGDPSRGVTRAVTMTGEPLEDPLLRCGLALAGANIASQAGGDDGILTGAEIVGLDLLGTDLVVLSACETGVGTVQNGEGVAGLRQAFQIAGAKDVVATLWHVPDQESAQIMTAFYGNLAQGLPPSRALREAQLAFINARREDRAAGEAAHPYLWAAYGVTGR